MVFSFVFTNCHLPSAILLCKKTANLTTNRLKRHIITHFCCVLRYANITLCFRLSKSFSENFFFSCPNVEEECEKARHGFSECLIIRSTSAINCSLSGKHNVYLEAKIWLESPPSAYSAVRLSLSVQRMIPIGGLSPSSFTSVE